MNRLYPYDDPQVLTDDLYVAYGGATGSSTVVERQLAYTLAEEWVAEHNNTPPILTIITGSFYYPQHGNSLQLDWAYLDNIKEFRFIDTKGETYHTIEGTANTYAAIRNKWRSTIDVFMWHGNCQGCGGLSIPYQYEIVYEAGLPGSMSASKKMLWAYTEAAQIILYEVLGYGNETPGLVGVKEFRNQQYSEKRMGMVNTVFGASPKAQLIRKILAGVRKLMIVGL